MKFCDKDQQRTELIPNEDESASLTIPAKMAIGDNDFGPSAEPLLRRSLAVTFDENDNMGSCCATVAMTDTSTMETLELTDMETMERTDNEAGGCLISEASLGVVSPPLLSPSSSSSSLEELLGAPVRLSRRRCQSGEALMVDVNERLAPLFLPQAPEQNVTPETKATSAHTGKPRRQKRDHGAPDNTRRSPWLIPADHPYKIAWDLCTILLSFASAILTHQSIRDRSFQITPTWVLTQLWFITDIVLNFFTIKVLEDGTRVEHEKGVWARYLTTWFTIDVLSLVPWENLYVQPIIDRQRRRNLFVKSFFRTRAVVRVTRLLRGRHFRAFGRVARQTKHAGVGARRLLRLIIKYVPKYLLFYRNMKGILAVRLLRLVHWLRKLGKHMFYSSLATDAKEGEEAEPNQATEETRENTRTMRALLLTPPLRRRVRALSTAFDRHETFDDITEQMS